MKLIVKTVDGSYFRVTACPAELETYSTLEGKKIWWCDHREVWEEQTGIYGVRVAQVIWWTRHRAEEDGVS